MALKEAKPHTFLQGGGEMGELIRQKDWSKTAIGTPEDWPQSLRIAISIVLNSQFPMFVWWGPDLITFYNDSYRVIAGEKHPAALGKPGPLVWAEIWNVVGPLADNVMTEGVSNWAEDQILYVNRRGYVEETYFTFSYSPVLDEAGSIRGVFCACTETTEKVMASRRIEESERNLRNTILQAPVAMCILRGLSFVVEIANDLMYELWGRGADELLNRGIFDGLPEARHQGLEEPLMQVYTTGVSYSAKEHPVTLMKANKLENVFFNFVYRPFFEGDGSISGIIAVAIDVTEQVYARKRIEESEQYLQHHIQERTAELQQKNEELKKSNTILEDFAYAASHDMKEPIRKIQYFSDRLMDNLHSKLSENDVHLINRMQHATHRMRTLIDDLLSYSDVSRGLSSMEEIDLYRKVQLVLEDLELEIEQKGARIIVDPLPTIKGQRRQIQQLFQNLIGNALKYNREGIHPEVKISSRVVTGRDSGFTLPVEEADKSYHLLTVQDNGIGFEQKDAERIFNMFTRLHGNSEYRGTGIGLSIARKVVDNHNGYIRAESTPGEGALFQILLPV
jgi:hypothetical protein